ncbi:MAG: hypothetical protein ACLFN5_07445 [bacterium]
MENPDVEAAVSSAIQKEQREGHYLLERFRRKIKSYEKEYKMDTEAFVDQFDRGELEDSEDFFEWRALYKSVKHWEEKVKTLEKAS